MDVMVVVEGDEAAAGAGKDMDVMVGVIVKGGVIVMHTGIVTREKAMKVLKNQSNQLSNQKFLTMLLHRLLLPRQLPTPTLQKSMMEVSANRKIIHVEAKRKEIETTKGKINAKVITVIITETIAIEREDITVIVEAIRQDLPSPKKPFMNEDDFPALG